MKQRESGLSIVLDVAAAIVIVSFVFLQHGENRVELSGFTLWLWAVFVFLGGLSIWRRCHEWHRARTGGRRLKW